MNATLASTDPGRYPCEHEPMPLLRSLADRGARMAINMALLTELQESPTENPCKVQGRALRRRRFRIIREVQLSAHAPKRCRASLATAVQNAGAAVSRFGHSLTQ